VDKSTAYGLLGYFAVLAANIYPKLAVSDRAAAVAEAFNRRLLTPRAEP
jgi:hypothetical protein